MQKIVTIGGGSGQFALLSGLRDVEDIDISAIVSMVDSGGSTGRLRDELGTLPPGDILKCILALSPYQDAARNILQKRFEKDRRLKGHNAGNMLLTTLSRYTGSFPAGVQALAEILDTKGTILPVTIDKATLVAELTDGTRIYGESAIDVPRGQQRTKIKNVFMVPHHSETISVFPPVIDAISDADYIIIGPGDLFTSIIPNLIVPGLKEAIMNSSATLLYVLNIMTKYGETHQFAAKDFVTVLEEHTGSEINGIIYNTQKPDHELYAQYIKQKAEFIEIDMNNELRNTHRIFESDLLETSGGIIRHNSKKLAVLIQEIITH